MTIPTKDWISPKIKIREAAEKGKGMFAIEKIISGEPLIIFGGEYTDAKGAKKAKSTGKDWRLPELQGRYRNHFSPLINKRINNFRT